MEYIDSRNIQAHLQELQQKGTPEQIQDAIVNTSLLLDRDPDASYVRSAYLGLVQERGESDLQQQAIRQTSSWLQENWQKCDGYVFKAYLELVKKCGTLEQSNFASSQTSLWLESDTHESYVRKAWLLLAKEKLNLEKCQDVISSTASWLDENLYRCDSHVMTAYLQLTQHAGTEQQRHKAITQASFWLEKSPDNRYVLPQYLKLMNLAKRVKRKLISTPASTYSHFPLQKTIAKNNSPMNILHLSDLHFGTSTDAINWYSQLADDLRQLLPQLQSDQNEGIDALILSGDITNYSTPQEYEAAELFINRLLPDFGLKRHQLVIVPGNHDLNWERSKKAYKVEMCEYYAGSLDERNISKNNLILDGNYILVPDEQQYKERFQPFCDFYEKVTGQPYSLQPAQQYQLQHFPEFDLLVLGLNSAWKLNHHDTYKSRASINPDAITNAIEMINANPSYRNSRLKIAVWHHPLNSCGDDRIKEHDFMQRLAQNGFRVALHGHIHQAGTENYRYRGSQKIEIIAAGTFGAPVREWVPGYPLQYNLLKLQDDQLTVYTRKRSNINGAWQPDAMWVKENSMSADAWYNIPLSSATTANP